MDFIEGGVTAPKGFKASGIHCGIRKNKSKKDLALVVSDYPCGAACVYTTNKVKGAPLLVTKNNLSDGKARAVICNSGNANTCNADGEAVAKAMCKLTEKYAGVSETDVIIASTGVIGQPLDITPIAENMERLVSSLSYDGGGEAAEAIMTTDLIKKECAVAFEIGGVQCKIGGMAKGSGMIHPNMATMLAFITSDVNITSAMLKEAVDTDVTETFNMVTVDGDTSTNDMYSVMANGAAGNVLIDKKDENYYIFLSALNAVTKTLSRLIAKDGEGATKLIEAKVYGADTKNTAKTVAKAIVGSSLVKAAMFGSDANWGRVLCAAGYAGSDIDVEKIDVSFKSENGSIEVCKSGFGYPFDEVYAKKILSANEITIEVNLNSGTGNALAWGCDLSYEYVRINGDYRT